MSEYFEFGFVYGNRLYKIIAPATSINDLYTLLHNNQVISMATAICLLETAEWIKNKIDGEKYVSKTMLILFDSLPQRSLYDMQIELKSIGLI